MHFSFSPLMLVTACLMGSVSAYIAFKRQKNPYLWFSLGFLFGIFGIFAIFLISAKKKNSAQAPRQSVLKIGGPSDKFWYYLDPSQNQQGPMSKDGLTSAWKSGKIDISTFVWNEELPDWKPLKETLIKETEPV